MQVPKGDEIEKIMVKISGDGSKFSSSLNFLLLSFSLPGTTENMFFQVQVHQIICIIIILTEWCSKYINVLMCHYMLNEHQHLYIVHIHVGNHTFAAIRGCESYELIGALSEVIGEVNSLITSQSLPAVPVVMFEVVLGGDYKVQYLHIL